MEYFRAALLQLMTEDTLRGNLQKGLGAYLALFPEVWSTECHMPQALSKREIESPFLRKDCQAPSPKSFRDFNRQKHDFTGCEARCGTAAAQAQ